MLKCWFACHAVQASLGSVQEAGSRSCARPAAVHLPDTWVGYSGLSSCVVCASGGLRRPSRPRPLFTPTPRRTAAIKSSSSAHSLARPRRPECLPSPGTRLSIDNSDRNRPAARRQRSLPGSDSHLIPPDRYGSCAKMPSGVRSSVDRLLNSLTCRSRPAISLGRRS